MAFEKLRVTALLCVVLCSLSGNTLETPQTLQSTNDVDSLAENLQNFSESLVELEDATRKISSSLWQWGLESEAHAEAAASLACLNNGMVITVTKCDSDTWKGATDPELKSTMENLKILPSTCPPPSSFCSLLFGYDLQDGVRKPFCSVDSTKNCFSQAKKRGGWKNLAGDVKKCQDKKQDPTLDCAQLTKALHSQFDKVTQSCQHPDPSVTYACRRAVQTAAQVAPIIGVAPPSVAALKASGKSEKKPSSSAKAEGKDASPTKAGAETPRDIASEATRRAHHPAGANSCKLPHPEELNCAGKNPATQLHLGNPTTGQPILIVGDSLTCGPFGQKLVSVLQEKNPGSEIQVFCYVGSSPKTWMLNGSSNLKCWNSKSANGGKPPVYTPPCNSPSSLMPGQISQILKSKSNTRVIFAMGANSDVPDAYYSTMVHDVSRAGNSCEWIGPPKSKRTSNSTLNQFYQDLPDRIGNCKLIDSRCSSSDLSSDALGGDSIHRNPCGAKTWVEGLIDEPSSQPALAAPPAEHNAK